jgi:hypothetical protein
MQIYQFASHSHPSVSAFTSNRAGDNLPDDYAPWFPINPDRAMFIDSPSERIAEAIRRHGFFLLAGGCAYSRRRREPLPEDVNLPPSHEKMVSVGDAFSRISHRPGFRREMADLVSLTGDEG